MWPNQVSTLKTIIHEPTNNHYTAIPTNYNLHHKALPQLQLHSNTHKSRVCDRHFTSFSPCFDSSLIGKLANEMFSNPFPSLTAEWPAGAFGEHFLTSQHTTKFATYSDSHFVRQVLHALHRLRCRKVPVICFLWKKVSPEVMRNWSVFISHVFLFNLVFLYTSHSLWCLWRTTGEMMVRGEMTVADSNIHHLYGCLG